MNRLLNIQIRVEAKAAQAEVTRLKGELNNLSKTMATLGSVVAKTEAQKKELAAATAKAAIAQDKLDKANRKLATAQAVVNDAVQSGTALMGQSMAIRQKNTTAILTEAQALEAVAKAQQEDAISVARATAARKASAKSMLDSFALKQRLGQVTSKNAEVNRLATAQMHQTIAARRADFQAAFQQALATSNLTKRWDEQVSSGSRLRTTLAATRAAMMGNEKGVIGLTNRMSALSTSMVNTGKNIQWTGRQLQFRFGVPLAIVTGLATKAALDIEREWTRVIKVYDGTTDELNLMKSGFEQLSSTLGVQQKEVLGLAASFAQAGLTGQEMFDAVAEAMRLMVLGEVEAEVATRGLITVMAAFGVQAKDLTGIVDDLNAIENNTAVSTNDLLIAMARAGGTASGYGVEINELAAMMASLVPTTGSAEDASRSLSFIMTRLMVPGTKAAEEAIAALDETVGGSISNAGTFTEKLHALFEALIATGQSDLEINETLATIFQPRQLNRARALFDDYARSIDGAEGTVSRYQTAIDVTNNSMGTHIQQLSQASDFVDTHADAQRELRSVLESHPQRWEIVKAQVVNLAAALGAQLLPFMIAFGAVVREVIQWFADLDPRIRGAIIVVAALTVAFATLTAVFGGFITLFGALGKVLAITSKGFLTLATAQAGSLVGILALTAGIALLVAAFWIMRDDIEQVSNDVVGAMQPAFSAITSALATVASAFGTAGRVIGNAAQAIGSAVARAFASVGSVLARAARSVVSAVSAIARSLGTGLGGPIKAVVTLVVNMARAFGSGMAGIARSVASGVSAIGRIFAAGLRGVFNIVLRAAQAIYKALQWLNPWARHSPSPIEQITTGVDEINHQFSRLDASAIPINEVADAFAAVTKELEDQKVVVGEWEDALNAAEDDLANAEEYLGDLEEKAADLESQLNDAQQALQDLGNVPLIGEGELDQALFDNEMAQVALELQLLNLEEAGAAEEAIQAVKDELDLLQNAADRLELEGKLEFDPKRREIDAAINPGQEEQSFEDIMAQIEDQQQLVADLTGEWENAVAAVADQQGIVDALTLRRDEIQDTYDLELEKLDELQEAYDALEERMAELDIGGAGGGGGLGGLGDLEDLAALDGLEEMDLDGILAGLESDAFDPDSVDAILAEMTGTFEDMDPFAPLREKFTAFSDFMDDWGKLMVPIMGGIGLLLIPGVGPIAAAMGALVLLVVSNWDSILGAFQGAWDWFNSRGTALKLLLLALFGAVTLGLGPLVMLVVQHWDTITGAFATAFSAISGFMQNVWNVMTTVWNGIVSVVVPIAQGLWQMILGVFQVGWGIIQLQLLAMAPAALAAWFLITEIVVPIVVSFWDTIKGIFAGAVTVLTLHWEAIKLVFQAAWWFIRDVVVPIAQGAWDAIKLAWSGVTGFFQLLWDAVKFAFETVWAFIRDVVVPIATGVWDAIKLAWDPVQGFFELLWDAVKIATEFVWNHIRDVVVPVATAVWDTIKLAWDPVQGFFEDLWSGVETAFSTTWTWIDDNILPKVETFTDKVESAFSTMADAIEGIWSGLKTGISTAWSGVVGVIAGPINTISGGINTFTGGIESVLGAVGVGWSIPDIPMINTSSGGGGGGHPLAMAQGGLIPTTEVGSGFTVSEARAIVGEGSRRHEEFVIPTDPKYRSRAQGLYAQLGDRLFAKGGVLPGSGIQHMALGGIIDKGISLLGGLPGVGQLTDLVSSANSVLNSAGSGVGGALGRGAGSKVITEVFNKAKAALVQALKTLGGIFGSGTGTQKNTGNKVPSAPPASRANLAMLNQLNSAGRLTNDRVFREIMADNQIDSGETAWLNRNSKYWGLFLPNFEAGGELPKLAQGAIVRARNGGTDVTVGEGGRDEAVIPLPRGFSPEDMGKSEINIHGDLSFPNVTDTSTIEEFVGALENLANSGANN